MNEQSASAPMKAISGAIQGATPPTVILPLHMLPVLPPRPTSWPMVLGIIASIVGGVGVLAYGCGSVMSVVSTPLMSAVSQQTGPGGSVFEAQMQVQSKFLWWTIGSSLLAMGLSTLLLCTGIGLMRRRPWTRSAAIWWAALRMLHAVLATVIGIKVSSEMFEAMQQAMQQQQSARGAAPTMPAMPFNIFGLMRGLGYVGAVISLLWYAAMPIFTLVWFSRAKIKAEVERWP